MSLQFVNLYGAPVSASPVESPTKKKVQPDELHKGFRVVGVSPKKVADAKADCNKKGDQFNLESFLCKASKRAVRSKPYEILGGHLFAWIWQQRPGGLRWKSGK